MLDRRRTRQLLLFLGNMVSGVVTVVVAFVVFALSVDQDPVAPVLIFGVAIALSTCGWRFGLQRRGRERGQAKRVAWQAFWVLIAWGAVPIAFWSIMLFFISSVSSGSSINSVFDAALVVIFLLVVLALWFTWVRSRRMLDLLWPTPGSARRSSEGPYLQLKL
jgi:hypothetical protein